MNDTRKINAWVSRWGWLLLFLFAIGYGANAQIQISGATGMPALEDLPNRLQVVMLRTGSPESVVLRFPDTGSGKLYRYTTKAIDAEEVADASLVDGMWVLAAPQLNCGYFVSKEDGLPQYYWVCNYADYAMSFTEVVGKPLESNPCAMLGLVVNQDIVPIPYYQPNGVPRVLDRGISVSYADMKWDAISQDFQPSVTELEAEVADDGRTIEVPASLADGAYRIHGDRFTKGLSTSFPEITTEEIMTARIQIHAVVDKADDMEENDDPSDGGDSHIVSAPFAITLTAYGNEPAVANYVWRIYRTEEGAENSILVYNGSYTEFTFREAGTYSIMLQATNRTGTCTDQVLLENYCKVAESSLTVPNAFSPYGSPGVNDIFRVKYSSLVRFDGRIFDSWGKEIFRWTNPDEGWDGKYRGKSMPTGVYYYVIEAEGADGIKYRRKGDINILRPAHEMPVDGVVSR